VQHEGRKLLVVEGELWRNEWVEPGDHSERVRGDKLPSTSFFITDSSGTRRCGDDLESTGGWLWFKPRVIDHLCTRRGGSLSWYTRDTGGVSASPSRSPTHFGLNRLGLVNVFGKDLGYLSHWIQTIWAGFNVSPEGGVSEELLAAQAEGTPADSQAPEEYFPKSIRLLNDVVQKEFGFKLIRSHEHYEALAKGVHRFRSTDQAGFFHLQRT
jgi:hypothetical protein